MGVIDAGRRAPHRRPFPQAPTCRVTARFQSLSLRSVIGWRRGLKPGSRDLEGRAAGLDTIEAEPTGRVGPDFDFGRSIIERHGDAGQHGAGRIVDDAFERLARLCPARRMATGRTSRAMTAATPMTAGRVGRRRSSRGFSIATILRSSVDTRAIRITATPGTLPGATMRAICAR